SLKITLSDGAEYTQDYRTPWVLRAIYDKVTQDPRYATPTAGLLLPPALGIQLVDAARQAYKDQPELLRGYRVLARDALADNEAHSVEFALRSSNGYVIRRDALSPEGRDQLAPL